MKNFEYRINGQVIRVKVDDRRGTIADVLVDGAHPTVAEEDMPAYAAVIALALIEHEVEVVHDDEPGVITLSSAGSSWSDPQHLMNPL